MLWVFTSLRAHVLGVFACLHAYVLTCLRAWRVCVLDILGVLAKLACLVCLHACVLVMMKFFIFLRVCVLGVLFCLISFTFQYLNLKILTVKILCALLRILIGKKHPKIKLQRLRKIRIWTFGSLVHQINSF